MSDLVSVVRVDLHETFGKKQFLVLAAALLLAVAVMASIGGGGGGGASVALPMLGVPGLMLGMTPINQAEQCGNRLFGVLPVNRRTVISGHFLAGIATVVGLLALGGGMLALAALATGQAMGEVLGSLVGLLVVLLIVYAVVTPMSLRFGARNAGIVLVLAFGFVVAASGFWYSMSGSGVASSDQPSGEPLWGLLAGGAALLTLVVLALSYLVSVRIYEHQDH
ncbi:ABC-2 transporter permease [Nigerium massiliense]|uniref:ABC-2 transporter permease n=1 Tax=Nigerium massiliense TaxID=1522317 RepID=UPI00058FADCA|nr:ABC-2 transporter permease [Nigerium massiliense]